MDYLDEVQKTYTLSFSRPGAHVVLQYYSFLRHGFHGFRHIIGQCLQEARYLSSKLEVTGIFTCVSDTHRLQRRTSSGSKRVASSPGQASGVCQTELEYRPGLPVVTITFSDLFKAVYQRAQLSVVARDLRRKGFSVPRMCHLCFCCDLGYIPGS